MVCKNCGTVNEDFLEDCFKCGNKLERNTSIAKPLKVFFAKFLIVFSILIVFFATTYYYALKSFNFEKEMVVIVNDFLLTKNIIFDYTDIVVRSIFTLIIDIIITSIIAALLFKKDYIYRKEGRILKYRMGFIHVLLSVILGYVYYKNTNKIGLSIEWGSIYIVLWALSSKIINRKIDAKSI